MPDIVMSCPLDMVFLTSPTSSIRLEMHSGRSICKRAATLPVAEFRINFLYFSHIYDCRQSRLSRVATTTTATTATAAAVTSRFGLGIFPAGGGPADLVWGFFRPAAVRPVGVGLGIFPAGGGPAGSALDWGFSGY